VLPRHGAWLIEASQWLAVAHCKKEALCCA